MTFYIRLLHVFGVVFWNIWAIYFSFFLKHFIHRNRIAVYHNVIVFDDVMCVIDGRESERERERERVWFRLRYAWFAFDVRTTINKLNKGSMLLFLYLIIVNIQVHLFIYVRNVMLVNDTVIDTIVNQQCVDIVLKQLKYLIINRSWCFIVVTVLIEVVM